MELIKLTANQVDKLSSYIAQILITTISKKDRVIMAVSGGKSPIPLFNKMSSIDLPWEKVTIVLVDERVVDVTNTDSNENLVKTYLLQNKAKKAKFIGLMNSDANKILSSANSTISNIDVAILGMGNDGHTASIFPDCKEFEYAIDKHNNETYIFTNPISANYTRITLTLNALKNIPHLILSISGNEKYNVLNEAQKHENKNYPISYLIKARSDIRVYWQEEGK